MGNPHAALGRPNERGHVMARGAVTRLAAGSRHPQRDLQHLAAAWFSTTSCFKPATAVPHTEPATDDLRVIVPHLTSSTVGVALAAFAALRSFALVCRHGSYSDLPPSLWEVPALAPAIAPCFIAEEAITRLAATTLVCDFPHPTFHDALLGRLEDPIFTVRWRATLALARGGMTAHSFLSEALSSATPRHLDRERYPDYFDALEALELKS